MALGLKCGGWDISVYQFVKNIEFGYIISRTLEERAQRLFSTKGKGSLDPSLMTKANKGKASKEKELSRHRELATLEAQVYRWDSITIIFLKKNYTNETYKFYC